MVRLDSSRLDEPPPRSRLRAAFALAFVALACAGGASATETVGFAAQSYGGAGTRPTGSSGESKLWWNDGKWWSSMWSATDGSFHIFELDAGQWLDTGVRLDDRSGTRADALWDGTHLYVASHSYTTAAVAGVASRLYRFSYDASAGTYTRDPGFPVAINGYRTRTLVLDEDTTGALWATWTQDGRVYVNRTTADDRTWDTPFALPAAGASGLSSDDAASVVAFGGRIGVLWTNQSDGKTYFAVHVDGSSPSAWSEEVALDVPPAVAGNLAATADSRGRVFAAVRTAATDPAAARTLLIVRSDQGTWTSHVFGTVGDDHAQAAVVVDEEDGVVRMFAAAGGTIYTKSAPLGAIQFEPGLGTPFIHDASTAALLNPTTTKQSADGTSGFVVLASNARTSTYWFNRGTDVRPLDVDFTATPSAGIPPLTVSFAATADPAVTGWSWDFGDGSRSDTQNPTHVYERSGRYTVTLAASTADGRSVTLTRRDSVLVNAAPNVRDDTATATEDASTTIAVLANDDPGATDAGAQTTAVEAISVQPQHGSATATRAAVAYVPAPDYYGDDSFVYRACDDGAPPLCSTARVQVHVAAVNDAPTAAADDVRAAEDGAIVFQPTANDIAGPPNERSQQLSLTRIVDPPAHGTVDVRAGRDQVGEITYRPAAGYTGDDTLSYEVCDDGTTADAPDPRCSEARVDVTVQRVVATAETAPLPSSGSAADDVAIWVDPADGAQSVIIGANKAAGGGLGVYDLDGSELQYVRAGKINNVDLRDGFPFAGGAAPLVAASDRNTEGGTRPNGAIVFYMLDPATRRLVNVSARWVLPGVPAYGLCLYRSAISGKTYVFVDSKSGDVEQWEVFDNGSGAVDARLVRSFSVGAMTEPCVADDDFGFLYIGAKNIGIWRYSAEPDGGNGRVLIDSTGTSGHLVPSIEGLAIAYTHGGGFLFASSQGDDTYTVYRRTGMNAFVGKFTVQSGDVDAVEDPEGIDVSTAELGPAFPGGVLVTEDSLNDGANQNYKLVPLQSVLRLDDVAAQLGPCRRPYSDSSPWNTPIGAGAAYDPDSDRYLATVTGALTADASQYTYPVYTVSPLVEPATVALSGWFSNVTDDGATLLNQRGGSVQLPLPPGAQPAAGSDAQIILLNPATGDEWGMSRLGQAADGSWIAWNAYHYNTHWNAVPPHDASGDPFFPRGAGVPYLAGLVRPCEIAQGRIDHALAFAYDFPSDKYVLPATKSDGNGTDPFDLPEGARLQLDPSLTDAEIRGWGCDGPCLTIAHALQEYGMYVIDNSGRPKVMVEYEGTAGWDGLIDSDTVRPIPLTAFKLLALPRG